ncbi:hypothetical protein BL250_06235 [Erwinia sp. OLTSP20]|uniref:EAL domain-containing protein n=1 Tax=unclassified Erwinia TaxID=2622719 RepID=UPI000C192511|nr:MULTISPECIES: EAL domain-containing protein [unclassified Erwinia]PIJ51842.1 hypothetical protein BV501_02600 [Erwinia sp. OAMSP11]PIJ74430.1 hypothetical protein BK416_04530 [Erwinia sp. OLSSP12]PIJ83737.1 hypothetical protein BLD47_03595 [Erwinia sp. OLCASP19]PIJ86780.1 hypothetical protein BLD46_02090 [Erwinia sp. OLMTSP26]PIJ88187.1 hypothetical protein BLD49_02770 [Erwinia sp. OLMDSP33]
MKVHLEADYTGSTVFSPTYRPDGKLLSVTLQLHFHQSSANVSIPQELMLPQLDEKQRLNLLQKKLQVAEKISSFLSENKIYVIIAVDDWTAKTIVNSEFLQHRLAAIKTLELEISEQFSGINQGIENDILKCLYHINPMSLANYGAGKANSKAVYDSLFKRITLDKSFLHQQIGKISFNPFFNAIVKNVRPYCQQLVVQGVDSAAMMQIIRQFDIDGVAGTLFPVVSEAGLPDLLPAPAVLVADPG